MAQANITYGRGVPLLVVPRPPIIASRAPTTSDNGLQLAFGQLWFYRQTATTGLWYIYQGAGIWDLFTSSSGDIVAVLGTASEITATTTGGTVTLSTPSAFIAPGSIASTTTVTAGTGLTVTTGGAAITGLTAVTGAITASTTITAGTGLVATAGGVTATAGNLVTSAVGAGLLTVPTVTSGAASGTVAANGRVVSVSFTSPSIAAGATLALTTSNTSITGSGTVLLASVSGATTGAALNIQSISNTASQAVFTIENGTGATTQTGTITITYLVLN